MPLPFDLPALSRGFAALSPAARAAGTAVAPAAAAALAAVLGQPVEIRGRVAPGAARDRSACAAVSLELAALPACARLEVEAGLVAAAVDVLGGGSGASALATALTPVEAAVLELLALAALDGACSVAEIERALAPRLCRGVPEPRSALAIELELTVGAHRGRARLLVDAAAIAALRDPTPAATAAGAALRLPVSVRSGRAPLAPDELAALSPGDAVVLDPPGTARDALVLPGGARLSGRLGEDAFQVEEVQMSERNAQLPVVLEVELARVELSLAELGRLEPGAALPLAIDRRGLVTLRAGERAVARGELVEIDGCVGVRVLSLEVAP